MYRKAKKNEPYTTKAHKEGYPARSVYKLQEMDAKFKLTTRGDKVLDLGASPGSWLMYVSKKVGPKGFVLGVDIAPLKIEVPKNAVFLQQSVMELTREDVFQYMGRVDAVISDMAPATSGVRALDAERSLELSFHALRLAQGVLKNGGVFVCKVLEGAGFPEFLQEVRGLFVKAERVKPKASTKESRELYVVAHGFKNQA